MTLPGLPEGVVPIRYGYGRSDRDFRIVDGKIAVARKEVASLIVEPAEGYRFQWDIRTNGYVVVGRGVRRVHAVFQFPEEKADAAIERLKSINGFNSVLEGEPEPPKAA